MASSASSSSDSSSETELDLDESSPVQLHRTPHSRDRAKLVQTVIRMKPQDLAEVSEEEEDAELLGSTEDQQQQQQSQSQSQRITQTPPSIPLKRPGADLDLSPPASTPRAAPLRSGNGNESLTEEFESEEDMDVDAEEVESPLYKEIEERRTRKQQRIKKMEDAQKKRSDEAIRMIFGGDLSPESMSRWLSKEAKWELLSAWDNVVDKDFSLARFGDPFEGLEHWL